MQITVSNTINVENPTPDFTAWVKKELTISNPEYTKKARMGFWTGNTPKTIELFEVRGNTLIIPFGMLREVLARRTSEDTIVNAFDAPVSVNYGMNDIPLYDYQKDAILAVFKANYGILQSPAGSGKTQMGISLIMGYKKRALWLTHTLDLLRQSKERAERYIDPSLIGTITEGKVNIGRGITFATVQTMCKLDLAQYKDYWDLIIVDECHRVSGSPTSVTMFYKVLNSLSARHKYGLSATVHRADGMIKATNALIGEVVYEVPQEAVSNNTMQVGILPVETRIGYTEECLNTDGTLCYAKMLNYLADSITRNMQIAGCIEDNAGIPSIILSDRLNHLVNIMDLLPDEMRGDAVMISGKMTSKSGKLAREKALDDMRTGRKKYLFATYSLAKEGLDIPRLERLYLTTPQKDSAVITQSIGRVARTFKGKNQPIAYDFVDNTRYAQKAYKTRCSTYKKIGCFFVGGEE